ncbi:MAG: alkylhydroperoxidase [Rhodospirillaceae bacterium]|jgi:uncharacterized peroxidase-related enzyme|nr:alkylhydroperoxidase [Rhodospirillaceae bacterium]|tara:strand:- start:3067 stop:3624 length:558 start_codon:yes stop_codon:yes gene_type:complete
MVADENADKFLNDIFDQARTPHGTLDNVMRIHSLRPSTMIGHLMLYKSVLHSDEITLPLWFLEVVAAYVSMLNSCEYSLTHHWNNAVSLLGNTKRAEEIRAALRTQKFQNVFDKKEIAILKYSQKLTQSVGKMEESDVKKLKKRGCDDGEILEVNQVVAYFNYSNRLLNGLGVSLDGDKIGYYSS